MVLIPISQEMNTHSVISFLVCRGRGDNIIPILQKMYMPPPIILSLIFQGTEDDVTPNIAESVQPPVMLFP